MTQKYTPGPWEASWAVRDGYDRRSQWGVFPQDEQECISNGAICDLSHSEIFRDLEEVEANANLIAAAPDLLKALDALLSMNIKGHTLLEGLQFSSEGREITGKVKSAIAKATGGIRYDEHPATASATEAAWRE